METPGQWLSLGGIEIRNKWEGMMAMTIFCILFFLRFYLFLDRGVGKGEKQQCVVASRTPPTGDLFCNPGMCSGNQTRHPLVCRPVLSHSATPARAHILYLDSSLSYTHMCICHNWRFVPFIVWKVYIKRKSKQMLDFR